VTSCYGDCGRCGDAICTVGRETVTSCYGDCGRCGDALCTAGAETAASCYQDCGRCGDALCSAGAETAASCYEDCGRCGDGICSAPDEDAPSCIDCRFCGDGLCTAGEENIASCYQDCGSCGDGICTRAHENANDCYRDCGECGDTVCTSGAEDVVSCPVDCTAEPTLLRGVNIAGAEFGEAKLPGTHTIDYLWPNASNGYSATYFTDKGMRVVRLPFRWERLQPTLRTALNAAELARLVATVAELEAAGATVILDPHNYARYFGKVINESTVTSADFADLWTRLATLFADDPQVIFGLMNEPHDMATSNWVAAANAALSAIRATGADNLVLVPGNHYTGAHSWAATWMSASQRNSVAMLAIVDPGNNFAFDVHQYLDANFVGTSPTCQSATVGSAAMADLTAWLRLNGYHAFLGEFGGGTNATCLAAIEDLVTYLERNDDVYIGWSYWAAGPWWDTSYFTSLEPDDDGDKPQMNVLAPFLR